MCQQRIVRLRFLTSIIDIDIIAEINQRSVLFDQVDEEICD